MYRRNSCGDSTAPCESPCLSGAESPLSPFIWTLAVRFDKKSRNQRTKGIGRPIDDVSSRSFLSPNTIKGFREVKVSHQAALWFGRPEAVTDGLRDSEGLVLTGE